MLSDLGLHHLRDVEQFDAHVGAARGEDVLGERVERDAVDLLGVRAVDAVLRLPPRKPGCVERQAGATRATGSRSWDGVAWGAGVRGARTLSYRESRVSQIMSLQSSPTEPKSCGLCRCQATSSTTFVWPV